MEDLLHDAADAGVLHERHAQQRLQERRRERVHHQHRLVLGRHFEQRLHQHRLQQHVLRVTETQRVLRKTAGEREKSQTHRTPRRVPTRQIQRKTAQCTSQFDAANVAQGIPKRTNQTPECFSQLSLTHNFATSCQPFLKINASDLKCAFLTLNECWNVPGSEFAKLTHKKTMSSVEPLCLDWVGSNRSWCMRDSPARNTEERSYLMCFRQLRHPTTRQRRLFSRNSTHANIWNSRACRT